MYEVNECWSEYYSELDPDRRRELYQTIIQEQEDDGANTFRKKLMDLPDGLRQGVKRPLLPVVLYVSCFSHCPALDRKR